mmetsp:Transcript_14661/g.27476  ORF Transcript_14661/g.27476 Transcript_14661/m.27476 type:complete len:89 (+) Transcript_14661:453-719(+)
MTGASNLELCLGISLSDLHQSSIASAGLLQKVTDICNLLWHLEILWTNAINLNLLTRKYPVLVLIVELEVDEEADVGERNCFVCLVKK